MKTFMNEIKISNRINESIKHLYKELINEGYDVSFHKDDGNYFLDIKSSEYAATYICYNRHNNTVAYSHTPDNRTITSEEHTTYFELDLSESVPNQILLIAIRKDIPRKEL